MARFIARSLRAARAASFAIAIVGVVAALAILSCTGVALADSSAAVHAGSGKGTAKTPDGSWRSSFLNQGNPADVIQWEEGGYEADGNVQPVNKWVEGKLTVGAGCVVAGPRVWTGFNDHLPGPRGSFADGQGKGYTKAGISGPKGTGYYSYWSIYVKGHLGSPDPSFDTRAQGLDPWCLTPSTFDSLPGPNYDLYLPVSLEQAQWTGHAGTKLHVSYETSAGDLDLLDITVGTSGVGVTGSTLSSVSFYLQDSLTEGPPADTDVPVTTDGIKAFITSHIVGDSLDSAVCVGVVLHDIPIPTTVMPGSAPASAPSTALASGAIAAGCEPIVAEVHADAEAFADESDGNFVVMPWSGVAYPPGDASVFVAPEGTAMVDLHFDPAGPPGPGAPTGDVALYGHDPGAGWMLLQTWDWTPGTTQSFVPPANVYEYRLVDCADDASPYTSHHGIVTFLTTGHAPPPPQPLTLPDLALGAVSHTANPFNPTLGSGGGAPTLIPIVPGLSLQQVPEDIGANHWAYLPIQMNVQPDPTRPWLYAGNDPNQPMLRQTWLNLSLDGLFDPLGNPIPSLPIQIDFMQGAIHQSFQGTASYDGSGHVQFPPIDLGPILAQPYQLAIGVPPSSNAPQPAGGEQTGRKIVAGWLASATAPSGAPGYFSMTAVIVSGGPTPVLAVGGPAAPEDGVIRFAAPAPNPFASVTRMEFATAERGPVRLTVFDLSGRAVRALVSGVMEAGRHTVAWDGRDAASHLAPAGVYYARVEAGAASVTRRVMLVR